jgi:sec-independent protein translocase protein TatB
VVIFGERLPSVAAKAGRAYRELRAMVANARSDLREQIGPELDGLNLREIDPRKMVGRSLFDDDDDEPGPPASSSDGAAASGDHRVAGPATTSGQSDPAPFDPDTT